MPILAVVFIILCCGAVCFGIIMHMPWISDTFKRIACALIAVCVVLWLMSLFGVLPASFRLPR